MTPSLTFETLGAALGGVVLTLVSAIAWFRKNRIDSVSANTVVESIQLWKDLNDKAQARATAAELRADEAEKRAREQASAFREQIEELSRRFHDLKLQTDAYGTENRRLTAKVATLSEEIAKLTQTNLDLVQQINNFTIGNS